VSKDRNAPISTVLYMQKTVIEKSIKKRHICFYYSTRLITADQSETLHYCINVR